MKVSYLSIGLLALFSPLTAAWSKEDREIFRIRDEIAAHETDSSATFYDILGIKPAASIDDITKAYRTKTRSLHPDKVKQKLKSDAKQKGGDATKLSKAALNKAVKEAGEAQARLSLIVNILKGPERDRYDHFLSNGFPLWKGTDYYYNRYRPGLGTVLTGVFLLCGGGVHYIILYMSWKRQTEFVHRYIKFARETAWGSAGIPAAEMPPTPTPAPVAEEEDGPPQPMNRKQRRMQEAEKKREEGRASGKKGRKAKSQPQSRDASEGPSGQRKRVVAENGKILVVDSLGDVYLEEEDKEGNVHEFLLDVNELPKPTFFDTAVVRMPIWMVRSTVGRILGRSQPAADITEGITIDAEDSDEAQRTPSTDSAGEDFEMLDKSTDSLNKAKTTGAQSGGRPNKRRGKKR